MIYFVFWHFGISTMKNHLSEHFESKYKWDQSFPVLIPTKERFKSRLHLDASPNFVLNLFWSYSCLISIAVLLLSRFYPSLGSNPVPVLSWCYLDPDVALVLSSLRLKRELAPVSGSECTLTIST
jgi:hypothetical protein